MNPAKIEIPHIINKLGNLGFIQESGLPFPIKRIYFISEVPQGEKRGQHGHKKLQQVIIALKGSFEIRVVKKNLDVHYLMNDFKFGLYIPSESWRELSNFTEDAVCLVLASLPYDEDDYVYDFNIFKSLYIENS